VARRLPEAIADFRLRMAVASQNLEVGQAHELGQGSHRHVEARSHADCWFEQRIDEPILCGPEL
jgi:hypothetical protein